ncbi:MAG: hypothetical protein V7K17_29520 [Nostoc sp.]
MSTKWQGAFVEAIASVQCVSLKKRLLLEGTLENKLSNFTPIETTFPPPDNSPLPPALKAFA